MDHNFSLPIFPERRHRTYTTCCIIPYISYSVYRNLLGPSDLQLLHHQRPTSLVMNYALVSGYSALTHQQMALQIVEAAGNTRISLTGVKLM